MAFRFVLWDVGFGGRSARQRPPLPSARRHQEEVEWVLAYPSHETTSRSSGLPVLFGWTAEGRHLIVVYEVIDDDTVYPVTAFDAP